MSASDDAENNNNNTQPSTSIPQPSPNPFRFNAEYLDIETGTYYLRARHFNPRTGRFTQPDPFWGIHNMQSDAASILQSGNLYMYVMHNPVAWVDPSGLFALLLSALGAIASRLNPNDHSGSGGVVHDSGNFARDLVDPHRSSTLHERASLSSQLNSRMFDMRIASGNVFTTMDAAALALHSMYDPNDRLEWGAWIYRVMLIDDPRRHSLGSSQLLGYTFGSLFVGEHNNVIVSMLAGGFDIVTVEHEGDGRLVVQKSALFHTHPNCTCMSQDRLSRADIGFSDATSLTVYASTSASGLLRHDPGWGTPVQVGPHGVIKRGGTPR